MKADGTRRVDLLGPITYFAAGKRDSLPEDVITAVETPEGYLRVEGRISGVGVYEYEDAEGNTWGELRLPEHVFDEESIDSFRLKPVCDDHPPVMVDSSNIKDYQAGQLGSKITRDGDYLRADMLITDSALIEKIKAGKTQLSNGYEVVAVQKSGTHDGKSYTNVQTMIRGNHNAVVDQARGGPGCRLLLDSAGAYTSYLSKDEQPMKVKDGKIMLGDAEFELPDEVSDLISQLKAKVEEQGAELAKLSSPEADEVEDMEEEKVEVEMKDSKEALLAKVDALQAQLNQVKSDQAAKIDARVNLVAAAKRILGDSAKTDGVSDLDLMRAVVAQALPAMAPKVKDSKSPEYIGAAYDAALEAARGQVDSSKELLGLAFHAHADAQQPVDLDGLYASYMDGLKTRVEQPQEKN